MTLSRRTNLLLRVVFLVSWVWANAMTAQEGPVMPPVTDLASSEIWIDGPDSVSPGNTPREPDVAIDNAGTRIHVWSSNDPDFVTGFDIFVRRFDAAGNPLEDPQMVNTTLEDDQQLPRVAVSADGSFLVIFQSREIPQGGMGIELLVRCRAYDADGNPLGNDQLVSTEATNSQNENYADVAALRTADGSPGGGYVVTWRNSQFTPEWGDIKASIVSAAGVPGAEFNVHDNDAGVERWSSVTELPNGGFLVVWVNTVNTTVRGRLFNSAGGPLGPEFEITTAANAAAGESTDAAIGWDGRVLVVWEDTGSEDPPLPPTTNTEIFGRMFQFDASGNDLDPLGAAFRINNLFDGIQNDPRVAEIGPMGFLVVWGSDTVSAGPDTTESIEGRVVSGNNAFDADGDGIDDNQIQYNVWDNDSGQNFPGNHGWYGRAATNWQSLTWDGVPEPDTINQLFIIGRDLEYCLFCSDFEWYSPASGGNLWRWSFTVGMQ